MGIKVVDAVKESIKRLFTDKGILAIAVVESAMLLIISLMYSSGPISNITGSLSTPSPDMGLVVSGIIQLVILSLATLLIQAFFTFAILAKSFYGSKMGINGALNAAINRYPSGILAAIIIGLALLVPYLVVILLTAISPILFLLVVPYIAYAAYVAIMLSIALPYAVIAKKGAVDSLRSSWRAVKGNWWSVFAAYLFLGILYFVVTTLIQIPVFAQMAPAYISVFSNGTHTAAQSQALTNAATKAANSPVGIVTGFIAQVLGAWLVILFALVYAQLSGYKEQHAQPAQQRAPQRKRAR